MEVIAPGLTVNAGLVLTHSCMEASCHLISDHSDHGFIHPLISFGLGQNGSDVFR